MTEKKINKVLSELQGIVRLGKDKQNKFGGFSYRTAEDILTEYKKNQKGTAVKLTDEPVEIAGRVYIKATVTLVIENESTSVSAYAREPQTQKGMNESQVTGSASSYARKYALMGLFALEDGSQDIDNQKPNGSNLRQVFNLRPYLEKIKSSKNLNELKNNFTIILKDLKKAKQLNAKNKDLLVTTKDAKKKSLESLMEINPDDINY